MWEIKLREIFKKFFMKKDLAEFLFSKVAGYQRDKILKGLDQIFFTNCFQKLLLLRTWIVSMIINEI